MHNHDFDLSIEEISKIEGHAALDLKVRNGQIAELKFRIADFKRFYTQAVEGKQIMGVPQQVARICGTCSNAHLLCSIKAIESALDVQVSEQTTTLRQLLNYGLMIRDHGLHLYVFVLPDLLEKDSILDLDENNPREHELLHNAFAVKQAGNNLSIWAGGRSVHAPYAMLGGFTRLPESAPEDLAAELVEIRPKVLDLIELFREDLTSVEEKDVNFAALNDPEYSFLLGDVVTSDGSQIPEEEFHDFLEHRVLPYSQASAYKLNGKLIMVGALARINLNENKLHSRTQQDAEKALELFPSSNIFHNNLAQAIEILHSIDHALDILQQFTPRAEKPLQIQPKGARGTAAIEAPRGILFHEYDIGADGKIRTAKIVVPTGMNQILIEQSLKTYLADKLSLSKEMIGLEAEKLVRAYDPCISCATHFLKVNWL